MSSGLNIVSKVLKESEEHIITCETISGEKYRGKLLEAEGNMNCEMTGVIATYPDGKTADIENIYIRGDKIKFILLPDYLKSSTSFRRQPVGSSGGREKPAFTRGSGRGNPSWGGPGGSRYGGRSGHMR